MRIGTWGVMIGICCGALAGCDDAPRHAPDDPFYVGKRPGPSAPAQDPSVGTGQSPMGGASQSGAGPYISGGGGGGL